MLIFLLFKVSLALHLSSELQYLIVFDKDNQANKKLSSILPTAGDLSVHT